MRATPQHRITLYLLVLLFAWANGFAAPNQGLQAAAAKASIAAGTATLATVNHTTETSVWQIPDNSPDHSIYGSCVAEETFEEEHHRKEGPNFVFLPEFMILPELSASVYPGYHPPHDDYRAERKQSTYLLDCTFLI